MNETEVNEVYECNKLFQVAGWFGLAVIMIFATAVAHALLLG